MYEALSYCWGDPSNLHRIFVQDQAGKESQYLDVTVNLSAALQRIRDPDMSRTLWIDALCIDQNNMKEREQLVGFMATIHAKANQVIFGLQRSMETEFDHSADSKVFQWMQDMSMGTQEAIIHMVPPLIDRIRKLLADDWFARIWVSVRRNT